MYQVDVKEKEQTTGDEIPHKWGTNFILIAIDTHPSMFIEKKNEDGSVTHLFKECISACYEMADALMFYKDKPHFAILLVNGDEKSDFIDKDLNFIEVVKILRSTSNLSNSELKQKYEQKKDTTDLGDFFLYCQKKLTQQAEAYERRFIMLTANSNPIKGSKRFIALNIGKTFDNIGVKFDLIALSNNFDYKIFYNEFFSLFSEAPNETICEDKDGLIEILTSNFFSYVRRRKCIFYPFQNNLDRYLHVAQVKLIHHKHLYNTDKVAPDGRPVRKCERDSYPRMCEVKLFEDEPVPLLQEDKRAILQHSLPIGFNLMYASQRQTEVGMVVTPPTIIQIHSKEAIEIKIFNQIWNYCVEKGCVLVCIKKYADYERVRFVELIPKFSNNYKMFLAKSIPYCSEILIPRSVRNFVGNQNECSAEESKVELVKQLIEMITFDYDPEMFPDPKYERKKAYIKAKLLDEPYEVPATLEENASAIPGFDKLIREFKEKFDIQDTDRGSKRKATVTASKSKRTK